MRLNSRESFWRKRKKNRKKKKANKLWKCPVAADKYSKRCSWSNISTSGQRFTMLFNPQRPERLKKKEKKEWGPQTKNKSNQYVDMWQGLWSGNQIMLNRHGARNVANFSVIFFSSVPLIIKFSNIRLREAVTSYQSTTGSIISDAVQRSGLH